MDPNEAQARADYDRVYGHGAWDFAQHTQNEAAAARRRNRRLNQLSSYNKDPNEGQMSQSMLDHQMNMQLQPTLNWLQGPEVAALPAVVQPVQLPYDLDAQVHWPVQLPFLPAQAAADANAQAAAFAAAQQYVPQAPAQAPALFFDPPQDQNVGIQEQLDAAMQQADFNEGGNAARRNALGPFGGSGFGKHYHSNDKYYICEKCGISRKTKSKCSKCRLVRYNKNNRPYFMLNGKRHYI